jgi:hypothetical protein
VKKINRAKYCCEGVVIYLFFPIRKSKKGLSNKKMKVSRIGRLDYYNPPSKGCVKNK